VDKEDGEDEGVDGTVVGATAASAVCDAMTAWRGEIASWFGCVAEAFFPTPRAVTRVRA
jgi:hypothetical protein